MRRLPDLFYSFLNEEWFAVYNEYVNMDNDRGTNSDDQRENLCTPARKEHDALGTLRQSGYRLSTISDWKTKKTNPAADNHDTLRGL